MKKIKMIFCSLMLGVLLFAGASCSDSIDFDQDCKNSEVAENEEGTDERRAWGGNAGRIGRVGDGGNDCSSHHRQRSHSTH